MKKAESFSRKISGPPDSSQTTWTKWRQTDRIERNIFESLTGRPRELYEQTKQTIKLRQTYTLWSFPTMANKSQRRTTETLYPKPSHLNPRRERDYMEGCLPVDEQRHRDKRAKHERASTLRRDNEWRKQNRDLRPFWSLFLDKFTRKCLRFLSSWKSPTKFPT